MEQRFFYLHVLVPSEEEEAKDEIVEPLAVENDVEVPSEEEITNEPKEEEVSSRYHYDEDFEVFKSAVINKDIKGVSAFASSDMIDAEAIIDAFNDVDFLKQLKAATFDDLATDTSGEEVLLVFSASFEGNDEDGNTYESGLFLYFYQGENGLLLENFLAAG